jgi:hypothetical protein
MTWAPNDAWFAAFAVDVGVAAARATTSTISSVDTLVAIDSPRRHADPDRYRHSR